LTTAETTSGHGGSATNTHCRLPVAQVACMQRSCLASTRPPSA
jgi:hypothetical protein